MNIHRLVWHLIIICNACMMHDELNSFFGFTPASTTHNIGCPSIMTLSKMSKKKKKKKKKKNLLFSKANTSSVSVAHKLVTLRVRAFFHKTIRVCHVYCNFKIGFTCRITVIFGTLIDGSLLINTLASNICFTYRNMFQNGVDALSKIVDAFSSKSSKFHLVLII